MADGVHERGERVAAAQRGSAEMVERRFALVAVRSLERAEAADLILLLGVVGATQFDDRRRARRSGSGTCSRR